MDQIPEAVDWAKQHGLYVVLDMHQDAWWNGATPEGTACRPGTDPMWGYDGAPEWATITDGAPRCQFQGRDISPAGNRAFQNFYFDTDGVQTALVDTWGKLATAFNDDPTVAGYDLLNEPGFGETAPVTTSFLLGRFYDRAITRSAPRVPRRSCSSSRASLVRSRLRQRADAGVHDTIATSCSPRTCTRNRSRWTGRWASRRSSAWNVSSRSPKRVADEYDAPVWSGEYGYWGDHADNLDRLRRYADAEDANLLGSAYWVWKQACGDPQGGVTEVTDALSTGHLRDRRGCAGRRSEGRNPEPRLPAHGSRRAHLAGGRRAEGRPHGHGRNPQLRSRGLGSRRT